MATIHSKLADGRHVWVPDGPGLKLSDLKDGDQLWTTHGSGYTLTVLRDGRAIGWSWVDVSGLDHCRAFEANYGRYAVVDSNHGINVLRAG